MLSWLPTLRALPGWSLPAAHVQAVGAQQTAGAGGVSTLMGGWGALVEAQLPGLREGPDLLV